MAVTLGKRKRRAEIGVSQKESLGRQREERLQNLLQKHFETTYKPLDITPPALTAADSLSDAVYGDKQNNDDGWEGLSESEEAEIVEVVRHESIHRADEALLKQERKSFMSNKAPSSSSSKNPQDEGRTKDAGSGDPTEVAHLKNDVALQRLLQESSLLHSSQTALGTMPSAMHPTTSSFNHIGKARHKALDLRMQSLGANASLFEQKKRPLPHRFGMVEKRRAREHQRRKEAKENGVILEKEVKTGPKKGREGRERGRTVGAPAVGRMKSGTLVLSKKDVRDIQGPSRDGLKKGKRR